MGVFISIYFYLLKLQPYFKEIKDMQISKSYNRRKQFSIDARIKFKIYIHSRCLCMICFLFSFIEYKI
jgi:hypothetical protein